MLAEDLRVALRKHHIDLFGNAAQASTDQHAGEVQQHFQVRIIGALTLHQLRDVGDFRVVKHQQGFAGDATADKTLADGRELLAVAGIGQRHVQLADFEDVHVRYRQLHKDAQHLGDQRGRPTDGNVDRFAERIVKTDDRVRCRTTPQRRLAGFVSSPN